MNRAEKTVRGNAKSLAAGYGRIDDQGSSANRPGDLASPEVDAEQTSVSRKDIETTINGVARPLKENPKLTTRGPSDDEKKRQHPKRPIEQDKSYHLTVLVDSILWGLKFSQNFENL
jgi:hypothetical protein